MPSRHRISTNNDCDNASYDHCWHTNYYVFHNYYHWCSLVPGSYSPKWLLLDSCC